MSEEDSKQDQQVKKVSKQTRSGRSKNIPLSKSEKARRRKNLERNYPAEVQLKSPGPERKFYLNERHLHRQAVLNAARATGEKSSIAETELLISRSIIPAERFLEEPELMGLTFVPYRYQSPWRRTENFAKVFDQVFREYEDRYFGKSIPAPSRDALSLWPDSDIIALWRARQYADSLGVPYSFYIRTAFEYRFRTGYRRCPKPGQLWHGGKIIEYINGEFKTQGGSSASREYNPASLDPMFFAENYRDDRIQRAAHKDLSLKAKMFPDFFKLSTILKSSRIITDRAARQQFGDPAVDRVQDYIPYGVRELSVPLTESQRPMLGCFGMHEPTATDCPTCPVRVECQALQAKVDANILAEYGSTDPVKAAATNAATLRKQRQRERERLDREAAAAPGANHALEVDSEGSLIDGPKPKPKP